jgi:hypothetical protein
MRFYGGRQLALVGPVILMAFYVIPELTLTATHFANTLLVALSVSSRCLPKGICAPKNQVS